MRLVGELKVWPEVRRSGILADWDDRMACSLDPDFVKRACGGVDGGNVGLVLVDGESRVEGATGDGEWMTEGMEERRMKTSRVQD